MKTNLFITISLFLSLIACKSDSKVPEAKTKIPKEITQTNFQSILDSTQVTGAILIFDEAANTYYSNNFTHAKKGFLPASTFKIPNSLIALETGVVKDTTTIMPWDGVERSVRIWNEDMSFKNAFHRSCVPCYQEIARQVGVDTMRHYLQLFGYEGMDVNEDNIDLFWLVGDSRISQSKQIDFLKRFYHEEIPISKRTYGIAKKMMLVKETSDYKILAKTGRTFEDNNSWYVGYVEKGDKVYYFTTNFFPKKEHHHSTRKDVMIAALKSLGIISEK